MRLCVADFRSAPVTSAKPMVYMCLAGALNSGSARTVFQYWAFQARETLIVQECYTLSVCLSYSLKFTDQNSRILITRSWKEHFGKASKSPRESRVVCRGRRAVGDAEKSVTEKIKGGEGRGFELDLDSNSELGPVINQAWDHYCLVLISRFGESSYGPRKVASTLDAPFWGDEIPDLQLDTIQSQVGLNFEVAPFYTASRVFSKKMG